MCVTWRRAWACLAVGAAVSTLAACGSNDGTAPTVTSVPVEAAGHAGDAAQSGDLVVAIAANLRAAEDQGALRFDTQEASCAAERVVAEVGVERLDELGAASAPWLTELAWTSDEREIVFTIVRDCVDVERQLAELFLTDPSMTPSLARCMAAHYATSDVLPDALFSTEYDPAIEAAVDEALEAAILDCGG